MLQLELAAGLHYRVRMHTSVASHCTLLYSAFGFIYRARSYTLEWQTRTLVHIHIALHHLPCLTNLEEAESRRFTDSS